MDTIVNSLWDAVSVLDHAYDYLQTANGGNIDYVYTKADYDAGEIIIKKANALRRLAVKQLLSKRN